MPKVYFYQAVSAQNSPEERPFPWEEGLRRFEGNGFSSRFARFQCEDGWYLLGIPFPDFGLLALYRLQQDSLPQIEHANKVRPLSLGKDESLAHVTWVKHFPQNVFAVLRSQFGPQQNRIETYISKRLFAPETPLRLTPLLMHDVRERLRKSKEAKWLQFKIPTSQIDFLEERNIRSILTSARDAYAGTEIEIKISVSGRQKSTKPSRDLFSEVSSLADSGNLDLFQKCRAGYVNPETERVEQIDLLKEHIAISAVLPGQIGHLTEKQAVDVIDQGYTGVKTQIRSAIGGS